jgi:hypothetical protein
MPTIQCKAMVKSAQRQCLRKTSGTLCYAHKNSKPVFEEGNIELVICIPKFMEERDEKDTKPINRYYNTYADYMIPPDLDEVARNGEKLYKKHNPNSYSRYNRVCIRCYKIIFDITICIKCNETLCLKCGIDNTACCECEEVFCGGCDTSVKGNAYSLDHDHTWKCQACRKV